jgi:hypothetical protein
MKTAQANCSLWKCWTMLNELIIWFNTTDKITVTGITDKLDISFGHVYSVLQDDLRYHRMCAASAESCWQKVLLSVMTIPGLYMTAVTVEMIWELKFEIILHPAYSANLASSNHHIFQPPEDMLHGHKHASDEEVKDHSICGFACRKNWSW